MVRSKHTPYIAHGGGGGLGGGGLGGGGGGGEGGKGGGDGVPPMQIARTLEEHGHCCHLHSPPMIAHWPFRLPHQNVQPMGWLPPETVHMLLDSWKFTPIHIRYGS